MGKRVILALLSTLLLGLAWLGVSGVVLLVALVPLMLLGHGLGDDKRSFFKMLGWTAAVTGVWSLITTWWVWYAAPIGTVAIFIAHILLFGGATMIWFWLSKRTRPLIADLVYVCGWVAAEYWLMQGEISFPWLALGNGFANDIWAVQWYEYTGVFGGSLWVMLCNVLIYESLVGRSKKKAAVAAAMAVIPMLISLVIYLNYEHKGQEVNVTVVQPNIDPYTEKFDSMTQEQQNDILLSLSAEAPADTDYIIWPETAVDDLIMDQAPNNSGSVYSFQQFLSEHYPEAQLIFGASTYRFYNEGQQSKTARKRGMMWLDIYNSALSLDAEGDMAIHHKNKLVVGAEKIPYANVLIPLLGNVIVDLGGISGQLGTDDAVVVFRRGEERPTSVATAICYESIYGSFLSRFVRGGAQMLTIITNDGWWHDTPGYKQHFSYARLRAVEMRRSVARSANTGISGFISPRGDVLDSLGWAQRGTISHKLTLNNEITFYAAHGDYVARISLLLFIMGLLYFIGQRYRNRH